MRRRAIPFLQVYALIVRRRWRVYLFVLIVISTLATVAHRFGTQVLKTPHPPPTLAGFWIATVVFFWLVDIAVWYMMWRRVTNPRRYDGLP